MVSAEHGPHLEETAALDPSVLTLQADIDSRVALRRGLGFQIKTTASDLGNEVGSHLSLLTGNLLDLELDVHNKHANIRIGAMSKSVMQINGHVRMRRDVARIRGSLELGWNGKPIVSNSRYSKLPVATFRVNALSKFACRSLKVPS